MNGPDPATVLTGDGSLSALNARYGELYGSRHGARAQSRTVFLEASGTDRHPAPRVLEVGFGLGQNFRTTLANVRERGAALDYLAYELHPVDVGVLRAVSAGDEAADDALWQAVLSRWPGTLEVMDGPLSLTVVQADVTRAPLPQRWATAVYLDPFSPAKNPEAWTPAFLARLAEALAPGGVLVSYSAAGQVRRALAAAGLRVEKRRGLAGKREFTVATKP